MLIHHISSFQFLLTVSEVGELLFDLNSFCVVWCGMPGMHSTGILAWYWLEMYRVYDICPESIWILDPVGFVLWKLWVGNWELCLMCISWRLTDVSFDLLPCRFPFGQALAEALKKNTSVTSIDLGGNSIGDEGVKAFCVPGFQVAAHGVFVASLVKGFVVCSCSSITFPVSNFCWLWVKWVNCFLTWTHSVWYDVVCLVCFLLGYWHDIGWKCIWVNDICPESIFILDPVGFVLWKLWVGNWELCLMCISWRLTDVSFDLLPCRFPFGQALAEALKKNTSVTSINLESNSIGDEAFPLARH